MAKILYEMSHSGDFEEFTFVGCDNLLTVAEFVAEFEPPPIWDGPHEAMDRFFRAAQDFVAAAKEGKEKP